jgi:hypothetical protein
VEVFLVDFLAGLPKRVPTLLYIYLCTLPQQSPWTSPLDRQVLFEGLVSLLRLLAPLSGILFELLPEGFAEVPQLLVSGLEHEVLFVQFFDEFYLFLQHLLIGGHNGLDLLATQATFLVYRIFHLV